MALKDITGNFAASGSNQEYKFQPAFFSREEWRKGYYSKIAFYNSIAFDSIPTEADGFTEQELIDYVLTNIIGQ